MDITPGEFADFCSSPSARSRRSDTRSSMRSETTGSLEILPPEEDVEQIFMSEELLSEDESEISPRSYQDNSRNVDSTRSSLLSNLYEGVNSESNDAPSLQSSRESTPTLLKDRESSEDQELAKLIKKMKKYDNILLQKMRRENQVKLQRLLFQKQMLEDLPVADGGSSIENLIANENKFLALMPPPGQIQEMLHRLESEEFIPIFQTQIDAEDDVKKSPSSPTAQKSNEENNPESQKKSERKAETSSKKSAMKKKQDFIKRNIELAKDAGNYVSMTDDEKTRLGELLSDLDDVESETHDSNKMLMARLAVAGEGYTPGSEDMEQLAEIDEKIQALLPQSEFDMICGTPKLGNMKKDLDIASLGEKIFKQKQAHANERIEAIQKRLETIDEEWKTTYEGTTPRLTNEQLQRLLDECSQPRSSTLSSLSLSTLSQNTDFDSRSQSEFSVLTAEVESTVDGSYYDPESARETNRSIVEKLPRETLEQLLAEARSSLGIAPPDESQSSDEDEAEEESPRDCPTPLFRQIDRNEASITECEEYGRSVELSLEDFESPAPTPYLH